jgi:hypothetical protein
MNVFTDLAEKAVKELGHAWKNMLSHSNEELKINEEFSRKGVEALMEEFDELMGSAPRSVMGGYDFPWK